MKVEVRKPYSRMSVPFQCSDLSLTRQADRLSCDVNHILSRYAKDGVLTHVQSSPGTYLDLDVSADDYHSALNSVIAAQAAFDALPSAVRERYHNDPHRFLGAIDSGTLDPDLYPVLGIPSPLAEQAAGGGAASPSGGASSPGAIAPE